MATFGRTAAQDVIWARLNVIREIGGGTLYSPEEGGYGDDELQEEWDELLAEYAEIHTENNTFG